MNIEKKHLLQDVRPAGARTAHLQACGTDRGAPGSSHFGWPGSAAAVRDVGYRGPLMIESFTADNTTIATAASVWCPLAPSQDALATEGLAFLRTLTTDPTIPRAETTHAFAPFNSDSCR